MKETPPTTDYDALIEVMRNRRSVRKFEPGRAVDRDILLRIAEAGRWAPSGANVQPWDFIVIDDADVLAGVIDIFLDQANRLKQHAQGFPAVYKRYLNNTVALIVVLGDPRWKVSFPHGATAASEAEYAANNENIFYASIGAAIQNLQLAVTACGLTSAWLSGGGEETTNAALAAHLGYPTFMRALGTIPIGYPVREPGRRYRRPLGQVVHFNHYQPSQFRSDAQVAFNHEHARPFTMYRQTESVADWDDAKEKLGAWYDAYATDVTNPDGELPSSAADGA